MKLIAAIVAVLLLAPAVGAVDPLDFLNPQTGTQPVALTGGDSPATYQVSCSSNTLAAGATLLLAAVTTGSTTNTLQAAGRPLRKRCFQNAGINKVAIGSSTVATSDFWILGESTNTATSPQYCTQNSGAYYCAPSVGVSAITVNVIQETQSQP